MDRMAAAMGAFTCIRSDPLVGSGQLSAHLSFITSKYSIGFHLATKQLGVRISYYLL